MVTAVTIPRREARFLKPRIFAVVWTLPDAPEVGDIFGLANRFGDLIEAYEITGLEGGPRYWRVSGTPTDEPEIDWMLDWNGS